MRIIIDEECVICGKRFRKISPNNNIVYNKVRQNVRTRRAVTCSRKCSKEYLRTYKKVNMNLKKLNTLKKRGAFNKL